MTAQTPSGPFPGAASPQQPAAGPYDPQQPGAHPGPVAYGPVPPPEPKPRSWFARHKILTGLGALVAVAVVVQALGGGSDQAGSGSSDSGAAQVAAQPAQADEAAGAGGSEQAAGTQDDAGPAFAGKQRGDKAVAAGQPLTADGVTITATELSPGDATLGPTTCSTVTIVNGSGAAIDVNALDWSLQDPAGVISNIGFAGSDNVLSAASVIDGGSLTADVCFDGQLGSGEYVLLYKPVFAWSGDRQAWVNQR